MNALDTRNALQQYCTSNHVDYAILFDGDWGTGKTEFVRNYLNTFHKYNFLHISLFGLSTIKEIENEIYKSMAFLEQNEELYGALNSISLSSEQARFGGVGFAIKSVFEYYKQRKINGSKKLIICFDDLERWNGDVDVCLSYVAKLVEQYNTRTIIICAQERLEEENKKSLNKALQKSIRYRYYFSHDSNYIVDEILSPLFKEKYSDCEILGLFLIQNKKEICDFISRFEFKNLRNIFTSLELFSIVYQNNKSTFDKSPVRALNFLFALIVMIFLLNGNILTENTKKLFEDKDSSSSYRFLSEVGYFEKEPILDSKTKETLSFLFHHDVAVSQYAIYSIIRYGYYIESYFDNAFESWEGNNDLASYFDVFQHWYLDDKSADILRKKIFKSFFIDCSIIHPKEILKFAQRVSSDIERGSLNIDFFKFKDKVKSHISYLSHFERLITDGIYMEDGYDEERYDCEDIRAYLKESILYIEGINNKNTIIDFWYKLGKYDDTEAIANRPELCLPIFNGIVPKDALSTLESLSNENLFEFARRMGGRYQEKRTCNEDDYVRANQLADLILEKYGDKYSVSSSHFKAIAKQIKNYHTD
ncbi:TPA: hypothetical protein JG855_000235 [Vibrio parahaemolyticus]|nr:hypothetical protein [Vibrio parahaemolyticus]HAV1501343.1 hypothetical protein [Vibrio parahaemolyticus]HBL4680819.1 hypothetical protein [Vibrio parahaemolyticus]